jgi:quercetin dioxygenase-like cupin family protein
VKTDPSHYKVLVDNASVRVLEVNYAAGAKSVMHSHPDAIIVPLTVQQGEVQHA